MHYDTQIERHPNTRLCRYIMRVTERELYTAKAKKLVMVLVMQGGG